jgi:hypothetical protein
VAGAGSAQDEHAQDQYHHPRPQGLLCLHQKLLLEILPTPIPRFPGSRCSAFLLFPGMATLPCGHCVSIHTRLHPPGDYSHPGGWEPGVDCPSLTGGATGKVSEGEAGRQARISLKGEASRVILVPRTV